MAKLTSFRGLASLTQLACLFTTAFAQWPEPEPFKDDVILSGIRDPALIRRISDGTYFLFGTNGNGTVHTAPSLRGPWTYRNEGALNAPQDVVAPQVYYLPDEGMYYMYYCQHTGPPESWWFNANIHIATSATMDPGTWVEHGLLGIPYNNKNVTRYHAGYNILDPSLLVVNSTSPINNELVQRDGTLPLGTEYFLSFGSYESGIFQAVLSDPKTLQHSDTNSSSTEFTINRLEWNSTELHSTEGSFQYAWPVDGSAPTKYYLFFSSGQCCDFAHKPAKSAGDAYKIMVCRADSPEGPYSDRDGKDCLKEDGGTIIMGSHGSVFAPGGQGLLYDDDVGGTVLYYHYLPANPETQTPVKTVGDNDAYFGWNKVDWDDEGWPHVVTMNDTETTWPIKREEEQRRAVRVEW
ncbi:Arabinan endo-1,5-alpha-L-arabinosidase A [Cytospora mali]|uniref:Endo-1,5-alpha-L-arabinanase A n=1 Tax=Cytospora mali TaxID=578113 RepID=A0A194VEW4_CYTMA|nr:Arabinan endo-1,5-alpha-L-arabinosidase A [Valsa mali var. pyri (nom. inval.)]